MKLRSGKKLDQSTQLSNILTQPKTYCFKNYRPPRICAIPAFVQSFINFANNQMTVGGKYHDFIWRNCDALLDDISGILDINTYSNLSLQEHCDRLTACLNILTKLQTSTSNNLTRIGKKIKQTDSHLRGLIGKILLLF